MDDVIQMRFGAYGQRTVTIGRVWVARYHGIMVSRYTDGERAIRLPYNGRKRNASLTTRALNKEESG